MDKARVERAVIWECHGHKMLGQCYGCQKVCLGEFVGEIKKSEQMKPNNWFEKETVSPFIDDSYEMSWWICPMCFSFNGGSFWKKRKY